MYAVDWNDSELNNPLYKSPIPCRWNENCVYNGCCTFVHPGEEGTGRKMFPGRVKIVKGVQIWEPPVVRLIGSPRFYERRRLGLSWPQWCAKMSMPAPIPLRKKCAMTHEKVYSTIASVLSETNVLAEMAAYGFFKPKMNAGKITGMLIEALELEELEELLSSPQGLAEYMAEACEVLRVS